MAQNLTDAQNRNAALAPFGSVISSFMATHLDGRSFEYETSRA